MSIKRSDIYAPYCGFGGMFVYSQKISVIAQERKAKAWRLCRMNLAIRDISHNLGDKNAQTFTEDLYKYNKVDFIMDNPSFNLKGWRKEYELTDDYRQKG